MLIAIAIAEEIQGSKDCIGARTQQRTFVGLVSHMNFDDLVLLSGLHPKMKNNLISNLSKRARRPGVESANFSIATKARMGVR